MFKKFCCKFFVFFWALFGAIIRNINVQKRGGGGAKGRLNNVKKKRRFGPEGRPLSSSKVAKVRCRKNKLAKPCNFKTLPTQ